MRPGGERKSASRVARLIFVAILVAGAISLAGASGAEALVDAAFAKFRAGEAEEQDWRPLYDEGVALAERAIEQAPDNARAHYALFLNLGRRAERGGLGAQIFIVRRLRKLLDRALELDPGYAEAWEAEGEMLLALPRLLGGSREKGEAALRRAAELDPTWAKPWLRLAEIHHADGEDAEARGLAERARALACDEAAARSAESCAVAKRLITLIDAR